MAQHERQLLKNAGDEIYRAWRRYLPHDEALQQAEQFARAIRALSSGPYRLGDVAALAEEALFEARQAAVAAEMVRR